MNIECCLEDLASETDSKRNSIEYILLVLLDDGDHKDYDGKTTYARRSTIKDTSSRSQQAVCHA